MKRRRYAKIICHDLNFFTRSCYSLCSVDEIYSVLTPRGLIFASKVHPVGLNSCFFTQGKRHIRGAFLQKTLSVLSHFCQFVFIQYFTIIIVAGHNCNL